MQLGGPHRNHAMLVGGAGRGSIFWCTQCVHWAVDHYGATLRKPCSGRTNSLCYQHCCERLLRGLLPLRARMQEGDESSGEAELLDAPAEGFWAGLAADSPPPSPGVGDCFAGSSRRLPAEAVEAERLPAAAGSMMEEGEEPDHSIVSDLCPAGAVGELMPVEAWCERKVLDAFQDCDDDEVSDVVW